VNVLNAVRGEKDLMTYPVRVAGNQVQVDVA
jgi:nitrite reductase/ring-hydroxylating ferredoxin subunit